MVSSIKSAWWCERRGVYAILDPALSKQPAHEIARAVLSAGCSVLQVRAKELSDRDFLNLASKLRELTRQYDTPLVINDRLDIASLVQADGVHLGQDDIPVTDAKSLLPRGCVGVSTHSLEQAKAAQEQGADLIAFGPIYATTSKKNPDPCVGLDALQQVTHALQTPVIAIGGITTDTAPLAYKAGAQYIAAISAILQAPDIEQAVRSMQPT